MEINKKFYEYLLQERDSLEKNNFPTYQKGLGKNFIIKCNANSDDVMKLARDVLVIVNYQYDEYSKDKWDDLDFWKSILPVKFINGFNKKFSFLSLIKKYRDSWTLDNWIFLMDPIDRSWFWWGATVLDKNYFVFSTRVLDDPFLSGSLRWLFLASGAIEVIDEDDI
ncbi:hypothetical protein F9B74_09145 [Pelistega sp. NLN82]|uniref:Uncharacterized protein n=1 Tax=Pelistega ratti TaxID=2652177 RepID=A0A6L9Y854_9BURK|nr:hypothetical protein [Pelistega ratti]NEN76473.1 hypothetical protein [Pelistega ratti]